MIPPTAPETIAPGRLLLRPRADDRLHWRNAAGEGDVAIEEVAELAASAAEVALVVPGEAVLLQEMPFEPHERRHLARTIPYALEEQLLSEVDELHFALGPVTAGGGGAGGETPDGSGRSRQAPVALVARAWLERWLGLLQTAGVEVQRVIPEPLLLPWSAGGWTLAAGPQRWVARLGRCQGFALEPDAALLALQIAARAALPERVVVWPFADDTAGSSAEIRARLPESLRALVVEEATAAGTGEPLVDLRQGDFARALPWRRWWLFWRWPAAALAGAALLQFAVAGLEYHRLQARNLELRQAVEQAYRAVEPRGVLNNAEVQLRRKVAALRGSEAGGFMPLLAAFGAGLAKVPEVTLQNLNYSERQRELRVNLIAPAFGDVERARLAVEAQGLRAELTGSSADGERTRAQLRVAELRGQAQPGASR